MKYTKTKYSIAVICKCGTCYAAHAIYGGLDIDGEFTETMADCVNNRGGKIQFTEDPITFGSCSCVERQEEKEEVIIDPSQLNLFL